ncbi:MAG: uracil-DNA glycosylase family protein [Phycisphaerales bacterium]
MIVLNNFGNEAWFEECQRNGDAEIVNASTGTWPGLIQLLTTVPIDRRDCYFTNAYVGLLKGDEDLLRDLPGTRRDAHFRQACEASLHQQLALVRPKLVLPMGGRAVALLGRASPSLRKWVGPRFGERQFNEIDRDGAAYVRQAAFPQVGLTCSAVALTHPSMRNQGGRNAVVDGHRRVGGDAEHAMIRTAMGLQSLT